MTDATIDTIDGRLAHCIESIPLIMREIIDKAIDHLELEPPIEPHNFTVEQYLSIRPMLVSIAGAAVPNPDDKEILFSTPGVICALAAATAEIGQYLQNPKINAKYKAAAEQYVFHVGMILQYVFAGGRAPWEFYDFGKPAIGND